MSLTAGGTLPLQKETVDRKKGKSMPLAKYFKGHGKQVMDSMKKSNGGNDKAAKPEFYATANSRGMKPGMSDNDADDMPMKKRKSIGQRIANMEG